MALSNVAMRTTGGGGSQASTKKKKRSAPQIVLTERDKTYSAPGTSGDPRNIGGLSATNPATGGPAVAPAASGFPGQTGGLRAATPFGQYFAPTTQGQAWADPQALVTSFFKFNDMPRFGGGYAMALDDAEKMGLLYLLLNNNTPGGLEQYGNAGPLDWAGKYLAQQFRPGAAAVGPQDVVGAMFNAPQGTPVYDALYGTPQTPQEQISNWLNTMSSGLAGTMPQPIYEALMARYQQAGRDFAAQRLRNPAGATTFGEYLTQQGLGPQRYGM